MMDAQRQRKRARLIGILIPGAGQLVSRDPLSAALVLLGTLFFWTAAALELVVPNHAGYPAPLQLFAALAELTPLITLVPDLVFAVVLALTLHLGAAFAAGSVRFGGEPPPSAAPASQPELEN